MGNSIVLSMNALIASVLLAVLPGSRTAVAVGS
jgi:hypothetical protein